MKRTFWFVAGVAVTAVVVWKAKELYQRATPKGVQQQLVKTSEKAGSSLNDFLATVKSAAAEREVELREALGLAEEGATEAPARHAVA